MASASDLTALEQQILLAAVRLYPDAYGVNIRGEIENRTGRAPSFGSIYAALDRLASKGYLTTRQGEATPERGGRAKLYYLVTGAGQSALRQSLRALDALRTGTELEGALAGAAS